MSHGRFMPGPAHPNWRGGLTVNQDGYLVIKAGRMRDKRAHRAYVERQMGRPLRPDEEVHHLCGNRACWPPTDFHLLICDAAIHHAMVRNGGRKKW